MLVIIYLLANAILTIIQITNLRNYFLKLKLAFDFHSIDSIMIFAKKMKLKSGEE